MITWLCANTLLTLFALAFIRLNGDAPHRLRFHACLPGLWCWLLPWPWLAADFLPLERVSPALPTLPAVPGLPLPGGGAGLAASGGIMQAAAVFLLAASAVGGGLFLASLYRQTRLLGQLRRASRPAGELWSRLDPRLLPARGRKPPALRVQNKIPGALTTGLWRPVIWIHEDLVRHPSLPAVLLHEARHARDHDNFHLLLITLTEKLLWWHPLVRILAASARRLQELGCDERCARVLPDYRDMLNALLLSLSGSRRPAPSLCSGIGRDGSFNAWRIRVLERSYPMKSKHYVAGGILLVSSLATVGWVSAQPSDQEAERWSSEDIPVRQDWQPGEERHRSEEEILRGLEIYAKNLEQAYDELKANYQALQADYEELRRESEGARAAN